MQNLEKRQILDFSIFEKALEDDCKVFFLEKSFKVISKIVSYRYVLFLQECNDADDVICSYHLS